MLIRNRQRHLPIPRPGRHSRDHEVKDFVAVARDVAVEKSLESDVAIVGAEGGELQSGVGMQMGPIIAEMFLVGEMLVVLVVVVWACVRVEEQVVRRVDDRKRGRKVGESIISRDPKV